MDSKDPVTVSVPVEALRALIESANGWRLQADGEFCASTAEHEESDREFQALVAAFNLPSEDGRTDG